MKNKIPTQLSEEKKSAEELSLYLEDENNIENRKTNRIYAIKNKDSSVFLFKDKECRIKVASYPAKHSLKPKKKYKHITLNFIKLRLIWV